MSDVDRNMKVEVRNVLHDVRKKSDGVRKVVYGVRNVSDRVKKVSDGVENVYNGVRMVSYWLRKVSGGFRKVSHGARKVSIIPLLQYLFSCSISEIGCQPKKTGGNGKNAIGEVTVCGLPPLFPLTFPPEFSKELFSQKCYPKAYSNS